MGRTTNDDFTVWLTINPEPDIAELIAKYGSYGAIPAEAWRDFDGRVKAWQRLRRERYGGAIDGRLSNLLAAGARRERRGGHRS